jgi:hypothetical protein
MYISLTAFDNVESLKGYWGNTETNLAATIMGLNYPIDPEYTIYRWDHTSNAIPDDDEIIKPYHDNNNVVQEYGRWLKVPFDGDVAPQVNSDWNSSSGPAMILNKPTISAVGQSGNYTDLLSKPALFSGVYSDLTGKPALFSGAYSDLTGKPTLFSGSYTDLTDKPSLAGQVAASAPNSRTVALGTAYQATQNTKAALVNINLTSTSSLSLSVGSTASADIVIGSTSAVASGTGTVVGKYSNGLTGTLVVGLAINAVQTTPISFLLPAGWYFAVRQTTGTVSVVSAFDQQISN